MEHLIERPDIADRSVRRRLKRRIRPYWTNGHQYSRLLGYQKLQSGGYWVARFRTKAGSYRQRRLGLADDFAIADGATVLTFDQAWVAADVWFQQPKQKRLATEPRRRGVNDNLSICPIGEEFTIGHALHDYVEWKRFAAAKSNFPILVGLINYHIVPKLAAVPVASFTPEAVRQFIREVMETPPRRGNRPEINAKLNIKSLSSNELRKRKRSANSCLSILRVALRMAWENSRIETERPWRMVRLFPNLNEPRTLHLSRDECRALLDNCRPDVRRFVMGALYTGCRASELVAMRCSHVGRDGYGVYVPMSKNGKPRFVFLPDEGMVWFLELIKGRSPGDFVFINDNTKRRMGAPSKLFRQAVAAAGLPSDFVFHGLRHTYASQLVQAGTPVIAVAEQLGHANAATVLRTYGHLAPQIRESEVRQRFTELSRANTHMAAKKHDELRKWRRRLHGSDWRTYAKISDLGSRKNSV